MVYINLIIELKIEKDEKVCIFIVKQRLLIFEMLLLP